MVTSLPKSCETDKDLMNIFQQLFGENKVVFIYMFLTFLKKNILDTY